MCTRHVSYQNMDDMFDSTVNIERICDINFGLVCTHVYTRHCTHTHTGTRQHHRRHTGVPALWDQLESMVPMATQTPPIHTHFDELIEGVHLRHRIVATVATLSS